MSSGSIILLVRFWSGSSAWSWEQLHTGTIAGSMSVGAGPTVGLVKERIAVALAISIGCRLSVLDASASFWGRTVGTGQIA